MSEVLKLTTGNSPVLGVLQARMSSSRFPGKVLKPILGQPMLLRQIERIQKTKRLDHLVVATSTDSSDDPIAKICASKGIDCFRGSLNDVLDRYYQVALIFRPAYVVRLTGDCPLIDPLVIDRVVDFCLQGTYDYASNAVIPTFPDGLDVEVFRFECLAEAWNEARLPSEREHVTLFVYKRPERFKVGHFKIETNFSDLRWTVDRPEDLEYVTRVYEALYPKNPNFGMDDVIDYLKRNPELAVLNAGHSRNEGLQRSLEEDNEYSNRSRP